MKNLISRRIEHFKNWWGRPATLKDRFTSALIGCIGGFWIGFLIKALITTAPTPISVLGLWGLYGAIFGIVIGFAFPKIVGTVLFPFSMIGIGSN